jgi:hypothetical protein
LSILHLISIWSCFVCDWMGAKNDLAWPQTSCLNVNVFQKKTEREKNMEIVLDTWTTNNTNGSKYDSRIVLRGHHNRQHNAKLKMWTQKFDLIENICAIRITYQRDLISPTPIGSSTEKGVHHLRDISTCRYNIDLPRCISRHFSKSIK